MEKIWLIIKNNYVINKVVWDGETDWTYPGEHDLIIEDVNQNIGIGDWYEEVEGLFYRPMGIPPDWPDELKPPPVQDDEENNLDELG